MTIPEAVAAWIKARADRLAHRHEWMEVDSVYTGWGRMTTSFLCKTCERSKVVKTY